MRTDHQIDVLNEEMAERGIWVFAGGLEPVDSATVVRSNAGETSMTDGPYAESKEQMGGFWVIEVADLDCRPGVGRQGRRGVRTPHRAPPDPRLSERDDVSEDLPAIFRREVGRCTATLIRVLGDVDLAEDAVAEAFAIVAAALAGDGRATEPGRLDHDHRPQPGDRPPAARVDPHRAPPRRPPTPRDPDMEPDDRAELGDLDAFVDVVPDDQLRLMFLCCHPALAPDAQVALTLRLLGGLETPEIARAFLVPEATMAQRIVRAKRKLRDNHAPYRIPRAAELPDRLHGVLVAVYLVFTEGHRATSGDELVRTDLSAEAIRLGRVLVELMPDEPEAVGLLALMLLTDARRPARLDADGSLVRLADQDRSRWDRTLIAEGHELVRACLRRNQPGPFQIQAAIAAVHADAPSAASHRLEPDRRPVRPAPRPTPEPGGGDEPGDRRRRAARGARRRRRTRGDRRRAARRLPAVPRGARRPARPCRPPGRRRGCVRPSTRAHHEPGRASLPRRSASGRHRRLTARSP